MKKTFLSIIFIIVTGVIVYGNSLSNGFVLDDSSQVLENNLVHSVQNIPMLFLGSSFGIGQNQVVGIYYKPLMTTSFAILYWLFGPHPLAFHIYQVSIFIINAVLVFFILKYFFDENMSLLLSLIFLVHSINTETATYISNLQDVLYFFFGAISLLILQMKSTKSGLKRSFFFFLFLILSLLSKEAGILFLIVSFLFVVFFNRK